MAAVQTNCARKMLMKISSLCVFSVLFALCFCLRAEDGGSLKGSIKYDGDAPEQKMDEVDATNQEACHGKTVPNESLVVDKATKGIKWTIIRVIDVKGAGAPPAPAKAPQLDQKGCQFTPHVVVVPPSTNLDVLNPDKIMHNIHTTPYDFINKEQNYAQGPAEPVKQYKAVWLAEPEIIEFKCDVHKWMKAFVVVHDPRFCAVTGADGTFEIKGIPPGKYQVSIWQESFGNYFPDPKDKKETFPVEIKAGAATDLGEMKFKPKPK